MTYRYVTTPIYYVMTGPTLAMPTRASMPTSWPAIRAAGNQVLLLTGADEHGERIAKAAMQADEPPGTVAERHARTFEETWRPSGGETGLVRPFAASSVAGSN